MVRRTAQALSLMVVIAFVAMAAFSVVAASNENEGSGDDDQGVVMRQLHAFGEKLHGLHGGVHGANHHGRSHGGGHHGAEMGHHMSHIVQLVEQLNLTEAQYAHFERVHEILGEGHESMAELHQQLMAELEDGYVETGSVRQIIDQRVEGMRTMAYGLSDELISLIDGLDAEQRETLMAHIEEAKVSG